MDCKPCKYCGVIPIAFAIHTSYEGWSVSIACTDPSCSKRRSEDKKKERREMAITKWNKEN